MSKAPDATSIAESAQALFCAIADYIGKDKTNKDFNLHKYPTYEDFWNNIYWTVYNKAVKRIETPGVTPTMIDDFLNTHEGWYKSSVLVAKKLVNDITDIDPDLNIAAKGFQSLYYFRGDDDVMGNIEKLFKIANKKVPALKGQITFGNVNKWSPADIYLASKTAKKDIATAVRNAKPGTFTFYNLNDLVSDLIDSGDLLPLSLKKTTKTVGLYKVNFDRAEELKTLSKLSIIKNNPTTDWKPYKKVAYGKKAETRDMRIWLNNDGEIKIRHDPSAARLVVEFIGSGAEARAGSIGSVKVFCDLLKVINPTLAATTLSKYQAGEKKYNAAIKTPRMVKLAQARSVGTAAQKKSAKNLYDFERGAISAIYIVNNIMPGLKKFFRGKSDKNQEQINAFIRLMYGYLTSRSPLSGKFVIAK